MNIPPPSVVSQFPPPPPFFRLFSSAITSSSSASSVSLFSPTSSSNIFSPNNNNASTSNGTTLPNLGTDGFPTTGNPLIDRFLRPPPPVIGSYRMFGEQYTVHLSKSISSSFSFFPRFIHSHSSSSMFESFLSPEDGRRVAKARSSRYQTTLPQRANR
jgi:hypothetical protein